LIDEMCASASRSASGVETKLGSTLWEAVEPLGLWARAHVAEILKSRKQFDEDAAN